MANLNTSRRFLVLLFSMVLLLLFLLLLYVLRKYIPKLLFNLHPNIDTCSSSDRSLPRLFKLQGPSLRRLFCTACWSTALDAGRAIR